MVKDNGSLILWFSLQVHVVLKYENDNSKQSFFIKRELDTFYM